MPIPPLGPPTPVEMYRPRSQRQLARAPLVLPGSNAPALVAYSAVDGAAVMEGDIMLGPASDLFSRYGIAPEPTTTFGAVATNRKSHLWPRGEIPYVIRSNAMGKRDAIEWAISQLNQTELKVRPRTNEADYVEFKSEEDSCWSYVGRIGGSQEIETGGCGRASIIHELLHAAGFWHEQSRSDRDSFVTIVWSEIDPDNRYNFELRTDRSQDIGAYDYDSIMHYSARAFSVRGRETIIPRQPNVRIGQREGLSAGDKAAIRFLYGGASPAPPPAPPPTPPSPPRPTPIPLSYSFAGNYTSTRGDVRCTQSGKQVSCQFAGGTLACVAKATLLDCMWGGSDGTGRAVFWREANGSLQGFWGNSSSYTSRGAWTLTPAGAPVRPLGRRRL